MNISSLQIAVTLWMNRCFGESIAKDKDERNFRFLEEALELVQAGGCTQQDAHKLVDYVYGRPVGELEQEVGGVSITLAALCQAHRISWEASAEDEYKRINQPEMIVKIRQKQATKPQRSPLPGKADGEDQAVKVYVTPAGASCIDEGCPWYGKNVICEQKPHGCVTTVLGPLVASTVTDINTAFADAASQMLKLPAVVMRTPYGGLKDEMEMTHSLLPFEVTTPLGQDNRIFEDFFKGTTVKPPFIFHSFPYQKAFLETPQIDIREEDMKLIEQAVAESDWIPPEYSRNEWVSDVCAFLRSRNV